MIEIYGWSSFQEWVGAGCPGAKSFDENGNEKRVRTTHLAKCRLEMCQRSMVREGLCLDHFEARRRRLARSA